MTITPISVRVLRPPKADLFVALAAALPKIEERSVVVITSKVVSIGEGRCIAKADAPDKDALIISESDKYLPREAVPGKFVMHTVKDNLFIPSAGIDESNGNDYYVLWPRDPYGAAHTIHAWLRKEYGVRDVGVIIADSHTIPLRRGVIGISLAHFGFLPLKDYRGTKDLFGRTLQITCLNLVDALAAAASTVMGEGNEATPVVVITDHPFLVFTDAPPPERSDLSLHIPETEDLYYPFLSCVAWKEGGHENPDLTA